ncbi:hypothetical protein HHI36_012598 [Cryptolaemus montrouzieri]|uniref:Uncharacterized protein n=1 Tax=Cryptolaemus montrouzieri TaxID=559131 RepID=A0ABD2NFR6_9CUCU
MFDYPITEEELVDIIRKNGGSSDICCMTSPLLKEIIPFVKTPLCSVLNNCLLNGIFPDNMKLAKYLQPTEEVPPDLPPERQGNVEVDKYASLPLVEGVSHKLSKLVNEQLNIKIAKYNLVSSSCFFVNKKHKVPIGKKRNVVYQIKCGNCDLSNVGRPLNLLIEE